MAKDKIDRLTETVKAGFANLETRSASLETRMEKGFAAVAEDIEEVRTELKGDIANVSEQLTNIEAEIKPITRARLPERVADIEKDLFGASKAPRIEHGR
jgi:hypothetical protein